MKNKNKTLEIISKVLFFDYKFTESERRKKIDKNIYKYKVKY
ncbi:hypothetical protein [Romboutsia weinsteinii]|nr:hypothetical protein [Romboutsia weinsteinii]